MIFKSLKKSSKSQISHEKSQNLRRFRKIFEDLNLCYFFSKLFSPRFLLNMVEDGFEQSSILCPLFSYVDKHILKWLSPVTKTCSSTIDVILFYRSCTGTQVEMEWTHPRCYGDALIDKYLLRLDNLHYVDLSNETTSYVFTSLEPGASYNFELQVWLLALRLSVDKSGY